MKTKHNVFAATSILLGAIFVMTITLFTFSISRPGKIPISAPRSLGAGIAYEVGADTMRMYKINDTFAYFVDDGYVAIMPHTTSSYPLNFACGSYQSASGPHIAYPAVEGDYAYAKTLNEHGDEVWTVLNITTGDIQTVASLNEIDVARGLNPDKPTITGEEIVAQHLEKLPYQKESCVSITMAEIILLAISLAGAGFVALRQKNTA